MMGVLLSACWLMAGCSVIDDDLSDCYDDQQFQMGYQLKLVTNMTTELQTQLTTMTELSVANALETHLKDIFSDFAHDVDLSFYDTEGKMERLQHDQHIMNANQSSYTLTLPMRKYMHLAVANIADNAVVGLVNDKQGVTSMLQQTAPPVNGKGILPSHTTGLFTARQPMEVLEGVDQTFNVRLYMANSAATLVLNPKGQTFTDINNLLCFCSVNFPSKDAAPASVKKRAATNPTLWQIKVYLTKADGKVTETVLDIQEPLKAGDLKVIKGELDDDGAVRPYDSTVGVSVTLDWNDGGTYNPEL